MRDDWHDDCCHISRMAVRQISPNTIERGTKTSDWAYWAMWILAPLAIAALLATVALSARRSQSGAATAAHPAEESAPHAFSSLSPMRRDFLLPQRRIYPYSVIPGGVESVRELRSALAHDAVAARHYQGFDVSKARLIRLTQDRETYVSYRMGNRVYWTSKKLKLRKGETILTDGRHDARTRCGNRLSNTPSKETSPKEPSPEEMEAMQDPAYLVRETPPAPEDPGLFGESAPPLDAQLFSPPGPLTPPPGSADWIPAPPPVFPIVGGGPVAPPYTPPSPPPPVAAPEPGTFFLLAAGLAAVAGLARFQTAQARRRA